VTIVSVHNRLSKMLAPSLAAPAETKAGPIIPPRPRGVKT
jgi:hypothetical protein